MYVMLRISHKHGVKRFSKSHVRADPPNRTGPINSIKTVDQCNVLRWSAESRAIPEIAKTIRTRIASAARMLRVLVHLLRDQTQHRLDLMMAATFETD